MPKGVWINAVAKGLLSLSLAGLKSVWVISGTRLITWLKEYFFYFFYLPRWLTRLLI